MTPFEIIDACARHYVIIRHGGEHLALEAPLGGELPESLWEELRAHKIELLRWLEWEEAADRLLLSSSERLARHHPTGCPLDCDAWQPHDEAIQHAYQHGDQDALVRALHEREQFARSVFEAYRREQR